jgi:tetratricopeptide (TPR) repeat protein
MASRNVPNKSDRSQIVFGFICFAVVALIIYAPTLGGAFIWDDGPMIYNNPLIHSPGGLGAIWAGRDVDYFPFTSTVFWAEWRLFGDHPAGYRIVNILLHAGSSVLIWRILKRLNVRGALVAGAIFCVHPVCVETVAWAAELKNTLSVFLALISALLFLKARPAREKQTGKSPARWDGRYLLLSIVAFALAMLSKISVVMLPVVLIAFIDWRKIADWIRLAPFFAVSLVLGLINIWFQHHHAMSSSELEYTPSLAVRIIGGGYAVWFYLAKIFIPLHLVPIYERWNIYEPSATNWIPLLGWICLLSVCGVLVRKSLLALAAFRGLAFFTIAAIPVLGFVPISFLAHSQVSDHLQYFPMIGIIAAAVCITAHLGENRPSTAPPKPMELKSQFARVSLVAIAILAVLAFRQGRLYGDVEKLWRYNLEENPKAAMAFANLAEIVAGRNQLDEATRLYRESVRLDTGNLNVREALAQVLMAQGRGDEAAVVLKTLLAYHPDRPRAHNNLGVILSASGQLAEAASEFQQVIKYAPDNEAAHVNLGAIDARLGRYDEAIAELQTALQLNPQNGRAQELLPQVRQMKTTAPPK